MNSFNHYAYGAVADWMYGAVCGINIDENAPGFENAILKPIADKRLHFAKASISTKYGILSSEWNINGDTIQYRFEVPNRAEIVLNGNTYEVEKGIHTFEFKMCE